MRDVNPTTIETLLDRIQLLEQEKATPSCLLCIKAPYYGATNV